jgi:hypothetical protein
VLSFALVTFAVLLLLLLLLLLASLSSSSFAPEKRFAADPDIQLVLELLLKSHVRLLFLSDSSPFSLLFFFFCFARGTC